MISGQISHTFHRVRELQIWWLAQCSFFPPLTILLIVICGFTIIPSFQIDIPIYQNDRQCAVVQTIKLYELSLFISWSYLYLNSKYNLHFSDWFIHQSVHFDRKGLERIISLDGFDVFCQRSLFVHWKWTFSKSTFTPNWTPIWELATVFWCCNLLLSSCFLQGYASYFGKMMNEEIILLE